MRHEIKTVGLIGLGAVGALYAERLMASGAQVRVIVDEARKRRYEREGVLVNGRRADFLYATPAQASPVDLLIIATKQGGLASAMDTAAGFVGEQTLLISLINGVISEEILSERFGVRNVLYSVAQGMDAVKMGNALTYEHPGLIVLGEKEPGEISERVRHTADFLNAHGVKVMPVGDMVRRQWLKLMLNVGINQTCMVFECDYGGVQREGKPRETMIAAMREARRLAGLEGYAITEEELEDWLRLIDTFAPDGMPSMRQDGLAHRRSEVELFSGTMKKLALKHGVQVPVNDWFYARIAEMEAAYD